MARPIAAGESAELEFKSLARANRSTGAPDNKMEETLLKTGAGFWNAAGGTLLVGVADGAVLGLEADLQTLGKRDVDGLELLLGQEQLGGRLGLAGFVSASFGAVGGRSVCRIDVAAATEPVWVTVGGSERLSVRTGNGTRELTGGKLLG